MFRVIIICANDMKLIHSSKVHMMNEMDYVTPYLLCHLLRRNCVTACIWYLLSLPARSFQHPPKAKPPATHSKLKLAVFT